MQCRFKAAISDLDSVVVDTAYLHFKIIKRKSMEEGPW